MRETILYQTPLLEIGQFTVNPNDPGFDQTGFVESPIMVFPQKSIWIQHTGSDPFVADPTLVNFYNEGQTYQRFAIDQTGDLCHWFRITDALLGQVVAKDQHHFSQQNMPCPAPVFLQHLLILKMIQQPVDEGLIEQAVLGLFTGLLKPDLLVDQCKQHNSRHKQLAEQVKATLHEDLSVNISLQQLSEKLHTSPYHLSRVFKKVTGQGINQYRRQQRLRQMLLSWRQQSTDLLELAMNHGFSSHAHMSASFKQVFGMTPSDCQKQIDLVG